MVQASLNRNLKLPEWSKKHAIRLQMFQGGSQQSNYNHMEDNYLDGPNLKETHDRLYEFISQEKMCSGTSISQIKPFSIIQCSMLLSKVKGHNNKVQNSLIMERKEREEGIRIRFHMRSTQ